MNSGPASVAYARFFDSGGGYKHRRLHVAAVATSDLEVLERLARAHLGWQPASLRAATFPVSIAAVATPSQRAKWIVLSIERTAIAGQVQ
jgi:hypothetical protein